MAIVIYNQLRELQIQEKDIYEFGNWIGSLIDKSEWEDIDDDQNYDDEIEPHRNSKGEIMEFPWDTFSYVVIPDTRDEIKSALEISEALGNSYRYDSDDLSKTFFVVK